MFCRNNENVYTVLVYLIVELTAFSPPQNGVWSMEYGVRDMSIIVRLNKHWREVAAPIKEFLYFLIQLPP